MNKESAPAPAPAAKRRAGKALRIIELSVSGVLIVLLVVLIFRFHLLGDGEADPTARWSDITVTEAKLGPLRDSLSVEATVQPLATIYMDAVEGGRVEKIFVEVGSVVKQGDPIVQMENANLLMDIMSREAELSQQSNNLRNTGLSMEQFKLQLSQQLTDIDNQILQQKKLYDRYAELDKDNLISKQSIEQARDQYDYLLKRKDLMEKSQKSELALRNSQFESLEQSLTRMQANLDSVKQKQDNLTIKAPIAGVVTALAVEIGQTKTAGQRLGQIDVLNGFKATAAIDEENLPRIEVGAAAEFDYDGRVYTLDVRKIFPEVREGKFQVELEFRGERPKGIKRGQTLHIRIGLGEVTQALLLPRGDYLKASDGDWVYRIDQVAGQAVRQSIRIGRQNAEVVEIVKGLKAGDRVITSAVGAFGARDTVVLKDK
ncbi:MAG: efflux RND transporter periplasmic adaptor subunit [Candidatus Aminicenantes bacterium]|nr:efflux RND transporter periplasmic adaptor subunit [Candidatus Aminicenantes bacterium]